jgi:hypothetical protein
MSDKTDRLTNLLADVLAAGDPGSLLYKLLDAVGAELVRADEAVKRLLKSHWVAYASGSGLDGLGATFGVRRRRLSDGSLETDEQFRLRLRSLVKLFTGGGTGPAVVGAVRSALGLPADLDQLRLPPEQKALRLDLERLVALEEFAPRAETLRETRVEAVALPSGAQVAQLVLEVELPTAREERPRIQWTITGGSPRILSVELEGSGEGVRTSSVRPGADPLVLSAGPDGQLAARLGGRDVTPSFANLDGTFPPRLPAVPATPSRWIFRAAGGYDLAVFDEDAFDLPQMLVEMLWVRYEPLTFDVRAPYNLKQAVVDLARQHGFPEGELLVYEGLPLERIQEVVDQTRAAGVRGRMQFWLPAYDRHDQHERLGMVVGAWPDDAGQAESLLVGSVSEAHDTQDADEALALGGVFDVATFDGPWGFT